MISNWFNFDPFASRIVRTAGVVIILNNIEFLLCHQTNSKGLSFPKGRVDSGESEIDAAIRELREETSISVDISMITNPKNPIMIQYKNKSKYRNLYLYTIYISDISEIGLESKIISSDKLQLSEIDWVGFVNKKDSISSLSKNFLSLTHLLK